MSRIAWSICAALAAPLLVPAAALATERVAFAPLYNDFGSYGVYIATQFAETTGLEVRDEREVAPMVLAAGCGFEDLDSDPACVLAVTGDEEIDALVTGDVTGTPYPTRVQLRVIDGMTGFLSGRVSVPLTNGLIADSDLEAAIEEVRALADRGGWTHVVDVGALDADNGGGRSSRDDDGDEREERREERDRDEEPRREERDEDRRGGGTDERRTMDSADDGGEDRIPMARVALSTDMTSRSFEVVGPGDDIVFIAPYYPGLGLQFAVWPLAFFLEGPATGLGLYLDTVRHSLVTVTEVVNAEETVRYDLEIPTRHNLSELGLTYTYRLHSGISLDAAVGSRAVAYSLGSNERYESSFYSGMQFALGGGYLLLDEHLQTEARVVIRPSVDLGSTATAYGLSASGKGFGIVLGGRYRLSDGPFVGLSWRLDRYAATYKGDPESEAPGDSEATDLFQSFALSIGYEY